MIILCAIDSGYDPRKQQRAKDFAGKANIVYDFVARRQMRFKAIMGIPGDKGIELLQEAKVGDPNCILKKRYNVYVSMIKEILTYQLPLESGPGAIHFPRYMRTVGEQRELLPDEHYKRFL